MFHCLLVFFINVSRAVSSFSLAPLASSAGSSPLRLPWCTAWYLCNLPNVVELRPFILFISAIDCDWPSVTGAWMLCIGPVYTTYGFLLAPAGSFMFPYISATKLPKEPVLPNLLLPFFLISTSLSIRGNVVLLKCSTAIWLCAFTPVVTIFGASLAAERSIASTDVLLFIFMVVELRVELNLQNKINYQKLNIYSLFS